MKWPLRVLPILGVALVGVGMKLPSAYVDLMETRADPQSAPVTFLPFEGPLEFYLRSYLLAAVLIGGGLIAAIAIIRARSGSFPSGFILGSGLVGLASFLGMTLMITDRVVEGLPSGGRWSVGAGYFFGLAGSVVLIVSGIATRSDEGSFHSGRSRLHKVRLALGMVFLTVGLVAPTVYRNLPDVRSFPGPVAQPIVSFEGLFSRLLSGYLLGAVLVGGALWVLVAIIRNRESDFVSGFGLSIGLVGLATFLSHVLMILNGPNRDPYPEGAFSVGIGFFLGIAGALVLVVSCVPKEEPVAEAT